MYPDALSVGEARERFFERLGLGPDGGYAARWVKLKAGPVPLRFPNTAARVRAVRLHDLHHIATGYEPIWIGEAEIGAWELASGCRGYVAAWVLNAGGFVIGLLIAPARLFRAFVRGRRSKNLYAEGFREALLRENLGELRRRLGLLEPEAPPSAVDVLAFGAWSLALVGTLVVVAAALALAVWSLFRIWRAAG